MNHSNTSVQEIIQQGHENIDNVAELEIELIENKAQKLLKKNELASNKLIAQSMGIIEKHYGATESSRTHSE